MVPYGYSNDSMGTGEMFLELKNNHFFSEIIQFCLPTSQEFSGETNYRGYLEKKHETRRNSMAGYCFA